MYSVWEGMRERDGEERDGHRREEKEGGLEFVRQGFARGKYPAPSANEVTFYTHSECSDRGSVRLRPYAAPLPLRPYAREGEVMRFWPANRPFPSWSGTSFCASVDDIKAGWPERGCLQACLKTTSSNWGGTQFPGRFSSFSSLPERVKNPRLEAI